jgi:hypothetical protein
VVAVAAAYKIITWVLAAQDFLVPPLVLLAEMVTGLAQVVLEYLAVAVAVLVDQV